MENELKIMNINGKCHYIQAMIKDLEELGFEFVNKFYKDNLITHSFALVKKDISNYKKLFFGGLWGKGETFYLPNDWVKVLDFCNEQLEIYNKLYKLEKIIYVGDNKTEIRINKDGIFNLEGINYKNNFNIFENLTTCGNWDGDFSDFSVNLGYIKNMTFEEIKQIQKIYKEIGN